MPKRGLAQGWRRLGLALSTLVCAVLCAELGWRAARAAGWWEGSIPVPLVFDGELGWRLAEGWSGRHRSAEFDVAVVTDARGHRVPGLRDGGQSAGLLFVGDSLTFGLGVEAEESFPERVGAGLGLSVANLGVPGYGPDQAYLAMRRQIGRIRPRVALYTFCPNDLTEVRYGVRYGRAKPWARLENGSLRFSPATERSGWFERHSLLLRSLRGAIERWSTPEAAADRGEAESQVTLMLLVDAMAATAHQVGASFVVFGQLPGWLAPSTSWRPGDRRVDVSGAFAQAEMHGDRLCFSDGHWNPHAHALAAATLEAALNGASP